MKLKKKIDLEVEIDLSEILQNITEEEKLSIIESCFLSADYKKDYFFKQKVVELAKKYHFISSLQRNK